MELAVGLGVDEMTDIYAKAQVHANRFNRYPCQTECFVSSEKKNRFVTKARLIPSPTAQPTHDWLDSFFSFPSAFQACTSASSRAVEPRKGKEREWVGGQGEDAVEEYPPGDCCHRGECVQGEFEES